MTDCEAGWAGPRVNLSSKHGDWSGEPERPCGLTAVTTVASGCGCQHVETWQVCARCQLAVVSRAGRGRTYCPRCRPGCDCRVLLSVPALAVTQ